MKGKAKSAFLIQSDNSEQKNEKTILSSFIHSHVVINTYDFNLIKIFLETFVMVLFSLQLLNLLNMKKNPNTP